MEDKRYFCEKCFKIVKPNRKNALMWGDKSDNSVDAVTHRKPCGDECNPDDSQLWSLNFTKEEIIEKARERIEFQETVKHDLGHRLDFCMKLLIGKRNVPEFHRFLEKKGYKPLK